VHKTFDASNEKVHFRRGSILCHAISLVIIIITGHPMVEEFHSCIVIGRMFKLSSTLMK